MGVHWKIRLLGRGGEDSRKMDIEGGLGQFTDLRMGGMGGNGVGGGGGLGKKDGGGVFLGGGLYPDAHYALKYTHRKSFTVSSYMPDRALHMTLLLFCQKACENISLDFGQYLISMK